MNSPNPDATGPTRSNLVTRFMTAGIAVPLILYMLFWGPSWAWPGFLLLASAIAAQELFAMTLRGHSLLQAWAIGVSLLLTYGAYGELARPPSWYASLGEGFALITFTLPLLSLIVSLSRPLPSAEAGARMAWMVAGPFYVAGPLAALGALHTLPHGPAWLVVSMTLAWFADTGGYFAGRFLGGRIFAGRKMSPHVSPNKTWEGAIGGVVGSLLAALVAHFWYLPSLSVAGALALSLLGGPLGILGDLVESLIKRSTGTKDSGWIVPGHGGLIDRIDALMFTATATLLYARLVV